MKVKNYLMSNSFDEKIINWNRVSFDELVRLMSHDEISEMNNWLFRVDREIDSECYTYHEYASEVVYEYIKQWLIEQINENILIGTQELFEIYSAI